MLRFCVLFSYQRRGIPLRLETDDNTVEQFVDRYFSDLNECRQAKSVLYGFNNFPTGLVVSGVEELRAFQTRRVVQAQNEESVEDIDVTSTDVMENCVISHISDAQNRKHGDDDVKQMDSDSDLYRTKFFALKYLFTKMMTDIGAENGFRRTRVLRWKKIPQWVVLGDLKETILAERNFEDFSPTNAIVKLEKQKVTQLRASQNDDEEMARVFQYMEAHHLMSNTPRRDVIKIDSKKIKKMKSNPLVTDLVDDDNDISLEIDSKKRKMKTALSGDGISIGDAVAMSAGPPPDKKIKLNSGNASMPLLESNVSPESSMFEASKQVNASFGPNLSNDDDLLAQQYRENQIELDEKYKLETQDEMARSPE